MVKENVRHKVRARGPAFIWLFAFNHGQQHTGLMYRYVRYWYGTVENSTHASVGRPTLPTLQVSVGRHFSDTSILRSRSFHPTLRLATTMMMHHTTIPFPSY